MDFETIVWLVVGAFWIIGSLFKKKKKPEQEEQPVFEEEYHEDESPLEIPDSSSSQPVKPSPVPQSAPVPAPSSAAPAGGGLKEIMETLLKGLDPEQQQSPQIPKPIPVPLPTKAPEIRQPAIPEAKTSLAAQKDEQKKKLASEYNKPIIPDEVVHRKKIAEKAAVARKPLEASTIQDISRKRSVEELREYIVWSEILGKPVSMKD